MIATPTPTPTPEPGGGDGGGDGSTPTPTPELTPTPDPEVDSDPDADPDPEREIRELHAFFEAWYAGERDDFERLDRALAPEFEMITPEGERRGRETVLDGIERSKGQYADAEPPFRIDIEAVRERDVAGADRRLVTYEERQSGPDGETVRLSSALFALDASASNGVGWVHLHETWLAE